MGMSLFLTFLNNTTSEQLFGDNYQHLWISPILRGYFRKRTSPLYIKNSTINTSQEALEANRSILDMQGVSMDKAF
jgi:hypothetical protein